MTARYGMEIKNWAKGFFDIFQNGMMASQQNLGQFLQKEIEHDYMNRYMKSTNNNYGEKIYPEFCIRTLKD